MIEVPTKDWPGHQTRGYGTTGQSGPGATAKQESLLRRLLKEKEHGITDVDIWLLKALDTKASASAAIGQLIKCQRKVTVTSDREGGPVTEGMYRRGDRIFKVQKAVHGSGNLYAKELLPLDEPHVMKTKTVTHYFKYAPGEIRKLSGADRMTLEEAKAWGALYGTCCVCGATLTDERSIAAGIGPVCGKRF